MKILNIEVNLKAI